MKYQQLSSIAFIIILPGKMPKIHFFVNTVLDESANNATHDKNKLSYALTSYNKETIGFEL